MALRRLRLDAVWLLVSPGNPLKPAAGMAPLAERLASAQRIADGRRIVATALEAALGTRYTVDTLRLLHRRFPRVRFVWLMGADNLAQLPRWRRWRELVASVTFAVVPRPTYNHAALAGQAARHLRGAQLPARLAPTLADTAPPAWVFLPAPEMAASASAIRAARTAWPIAREYVAIARKPPDSKSPAAGTPGAKAPRKRTVPKPAAAPLPSAPGTPRKKAAAAGPRPRAAAPRPRKKTEPSRLEALQKLILASLEDDKAENVVTIDLAGRAAFADRMIIATGLADRQISAMATHLDQKISEAKFGHVQIEGANGADWVLLDAGDIVVHLFKPEARAMYALERMWGPELDDTP
mgnify:CR=1 FL=1